MTIDRQELEAHGAALAFGIPVKSIDNIDSGLVNATYLVRDISGLGYIVQAINTNVFPDPSKIMENYALIVKTAGRHMIVPEPLKTAAGTYLYTDGNSVWRCLTYITDSYSPTVLKNEQEAYVMARCFGRYSFLLSEEKPDLHTILPSFHDLSYRRSQLYDAIKVAGQERLHDAKKWLDRLNNYNHLFEKFGIIKSRTERFPVRYMHHDCKVSNILFHQKTHDVLCPIDFDTTQKGFFFSDLGDMMRTVLPNEGENHVALNELDIRNTYYEALMEGYLDSTAGLWTKEEREAMKWSGPMLLLIQGIRFLTDYLNNDVYYKTNYPEHNLNRAANQLTLLAILDRK